MSQITLNPDRWLLCSADIDASIRGPWAHDSGDRSLLALRLRSSQIELVTLESAPGRALELAKMRCGTIHLVVESLDKDVRVLVRVLKDLEAPMRLHVWREDPLDALSSLGAPEEAVLQALQRDRRLPQVIADGTTWPATYADAYEIALNQWADRASVEFPEEMARLYDPEAATLSEVIASLNTAVSTTLAAGAHTALFAVRRVVHMNGLVARPMSLNAGIETNSLQIAPRKIWDRGNGVILSAPLLQGGEEGEFEILAQASTKQMVLVERFILTISNAEETVSLQLPADDESLEWLDDGRGHSYTRAVVRYSAELAELLTDPAPVLDVAFVQRREQFTTSFSNESSEAIGARSEAANDWSWTEVSLGGLAAETPKNQFAAMRRLPSRESAERWSLARYPIVGQKAVYLMFEAEADCIGRYRGCRIQVLAEGKTLELGEVKDDGVAELRLDGTVDISLAVVRIWRPRHKE